MAETAGLVSPCEEEGEEEDEDGENEEYTIEKRADGTEDFHCTLPTCAGVFSYRTLRALNNHRSSTHRLPGIPRRKRGPKRSESSRNRCRSAEAIKRQVMKRAIDLSKREQGCRSMARLRASRLALAHAGNIAGKNHVSAVLKEVDKSLEIWEGASSKRRLLLERRIQMAKLEWTLKGEVLPLSFKEAEITIGGGHELHRSHLEEDKEAESRDETCSNGEQFPDTLCDVGPTPCEACLVEDQITCSDEVLNSCKITEANLGCNISGMEGHMQCGGSFEGSGPVILCTEKETWHTCRTSKYVEPNQQLQIPCEHCVIPEESKVIVGFDRDGVESLETELQHFVK